MWSAVATLTAIPPAEAADATSTRPAGKSPGLVALAAATEHDRYAYIFFWKVEGDATKRGRDAFEAALKSLGDRADAVSVCVADPEEKPTVDAFGVSRAPMPLVLAVAPNGAVTKAWPTGFSEANAAEGIVSPGMAACLKPLQDNKLVLVTVHNASMADAGPALDAVAGFLADERFAARAAGVVLDPADPAEAKFLADLKVSPESATPVTVLLAPPGNPVATFAGTVTTADIIAKVTDAASGCCPGGKCGPGQCCPGGKCDPPTSSSTKKVSK
jgi:hypothetical protein